MRCSFARVSGTNRIGSYRCILFFVELTICYLCRRFIDPRDAFDLRYLVACCGHGVETDIEGAQGFAEGPSDIVQCRFVLASLSSVIFWFVVVDFGWC